MPIYEFRCLACQARFSVFCRVDERPEHPPCERCQSAKTDRMISRFKTVRTEDQIMESLADPTRLAGIDENDPRSIARWAKKMAKEMGEDMGDEIEAMAEEEMGKMGKEGADESGGTESSPLAPPPTTDDFGDA